MFFNKYLFNRNKPTNKLGFALFLFGLTFLTQLYHGFNTAYYINTGIVTMTYASICKIVFVIVDWLNDIIFGFLSEKTHSKRLGKRVPWLIGGALFLPAFVILTYCVSKETNFSPVGFFVWYLIISISLENASTVMYTNYNAMFPTLFTTGKQRSEVASYKHGFEVIGMILCYLLTPILTDNFHLPYYVVGIIYSCVYIITLFILFKSINIKDDIQAVEIETEKFSFIDTFKDVLKEPSFIVFNIAQSFYSAILALIVSLYPFYCNYVLGIDGWQQSLCLGAFFGSLMVSLPIWYILIRKIGHTKSWLISFIGLPASTLLFLVPNNFVSGLIICLCVGPFIGGLMVCPDMISAELIDLDKLKFRVSREAALGSIATLIGRISVILTTIITAFLASYFGFQDATNPGEHPETTFRIAFGVMMPIIGLLGLIFAIIYVKISKKERIMLSAMKKEELDETTEVSITDLLKEDRKHRFISLEKFRFNKNKGQNNNFENNSNSSLEDQKDNSNNDKD